MGCRKRSNVLELVPEDFDIRGCLDPDPNLVAVDANNRQHDIIAQANTLRFSTRQDQHVEIPFPWIKL